MPRNPLPGNLMLKPSFPALEGETFSLPPAAKPSPLQPPPPPSSPTAEDECPKPCCYVPKSRAPSHPKHLLLQSPGPTCSRAGDKHALVPACNKSLARQDISGVVMLPQATSPSSFAAVHGAEVFLPPHSPAQRQSSPAVKVVPQGNASSKNNILPLAIPVRQCVCSQPDLESKGAC